GRDRDSPRQPARPTGRPRALGRDARSIRLPLLDDVPRVAKPPALGPRGPARRSHLQPDHRRRLYEALGQDRARSDARDPLTLEESPSWHTRYRRFRTTTTRWNRTSTNRRCGSTMTSITRRT